MLKKKAYYKVNIDLLAQERILSKKWLLKNKVFSNIFSINKYSKLNSLIFLITLLYYRNILIIKPFYDIVVSVSIIFLSY